MAAALSLGPAAPALAQAPPPPTKAGSAPAKGAAPPAKGAPPPAAPPAAPPPPAPAPPPGKAGAPATPEEEVMRLVADAQKAEKAGKWDEARALLLKAYKVKPSGRVLAELGRAEVGAEKYRDAAEHCAIALRDVSLTDEARKAAEAALAQAQAQVGALRINVHPRGAEIVVGGQPVGT